MGGVPKVASLWCGITILLIEALFLLRYLRHLRALQGLRNCRGQPHTALSLERLERRLNYLKAKYSERAPYWQFVLWTRELAIISVGEIFSQHSSGYLQALATLAVLAISLGLHVRARPYAYPSQNRAEMVCASTSLAFIALGIVYELVNEHIHNSSAVHVTDGMLFVIVLLPLCLFLLPATCFSRKSSSAAPAAAFAACRRPSSNSASLKNFACVCASEGGEW